MNKLVYGVQPWASFFVYDYIIGGMTTMTLWKKQLVAIVTMSMLFSSAMGVAAYAKGKPGQDQVWIDNEDDEDEEDDDEAEDEEEFEDEEASVTESVYGDDDSDDDEGKGKGKGKNKGKNKGKGLERALEKVKGTPAEAVIQDLLTGNVTEDDLEAIEDLVEDLEELGDEEAALETQEKVVQLSPKDLKAVKKLAKLLDKLGEDGLKAFVNGKRPNFDVQPFVENGRTLVPFRAMAEALEAEVSFDAATRTVTVKRGDTMVQLQLGSSVAWINGVEYPLDVPAQTVQNRTVIPMRFLAEAFGAEVTFDPETQSIIVIESETTDAAATDTTATDTTTNP
jgi:phosphoglycolate phosphatase-like HAD superfamily hydrolase